MIQFLWRTLYDLRSIQTEVMGPLAVIFFKTFEDLADRCRSFEYRKTGLQTSFMTKLLGKLLKFNIRLLRRTFPSLTELSKPPLAFSSVHVLNKRPLRFAFESQRKQIKRSGTKETSINPAGTRTCHASKTMIF